METFLRGTRDWRGVCQTPAAVKAFHDGEVARSDGSDDAAVGFVVVGVAHADAVASASVR